MHNAKIRSLVSAAEIQQRVDAIAVEVRRDYLDKPLTMLGVLTGCLVFLADLIRRVDIPMKIALMRASSYRGDATTAGQLHLEADIPGDLKDRHVLILDDILDTGKTLKAVVERIKAAGAASVRVGVLLRKVGRQEVHLEPDYVGFAIPNEFVIGYGLDYNDEYRNLPYIGVLEPAEES